MKKILSVFILLTLVLFNFYSCESHGKQTQNAIPEQSINYTSFILGNVIQDGKRAVILNFDSDYAVSKIEVTGTLLDKSGNTIHSFDKSTSFNTPSYNPEMAIMIEKDLVKSVKLVSFTKIKAYTTEKLN